LLLKDSLDHTAFEALFREHFPFLVSFARKYVQDEEASKDIVHNVFLNLWQRRNELDMNQSLKPYLFKSVHNRCLNYIRDHKKIVQHELPQQENEVMSYLESDSHIQQSELEFKIKQVIDGLPDRCREVFVLNRFEEKKYAEIADMLKISVKAVEAQMSKALKVLRIELQEYLPFLLFFLTDILG